MFVGLLINTFTGCSQTPSRKEVVAAYEAAQNEKNIDSLLILMDDNIRADFVGMGPQLHGKDEMRGKARYDSILNSFVTINITASRRDTIFTEVSENNTWLIEAGLPPNTYKSYIFLIGGGKIKGIRTELSDSSIERVNEIMGELIPWAQQNRPDEYGRLVSDELFMFSPENANLSLSILRDWKNADGKSLHQ
jgi:hypothetical protein